MTRSRTPAVLGTVPRAASVAMERALVVCVCLLVAVIAMFRAGNFASVLVTLRRNSVKQDLACEGHLVPKIGQSAWNAHLTLCLADVHTVTLDTTMFSPGRRLRLTLPSVPCSVCSVIPRSLRHYPRGACCFVIFVVLWYSQASELARVRASSVAVLLHVSLYSVSCSGLCRR